MSDHSTVPSRSPSPENNIFACDESLAPSRTNKTPSTTSLSLINLLQPPLLLHEDLKEGCGGQLWPAGILLAEHIVKQARHGTLDLRNKSIIEIGAGGGLVGLAVARGCPDQITSSVPILITDQVPMLALMRKNISLNGLDQVVHADVYDWGSAPPTTFAPHPSSSASNARYPDIILAADCVYFEPAFPLLLRTLQDLIGPATTCFFCFKKRRKADWRFIRSMQAVLDVAPVVYDRLPAQDESTRGIYLYAVTRRKKN